MSEGIYRIFDSIWRLSLVGSYCILLVLLARLLLQKTPKWCSYLLWGIVFVRLCCPVLPETGISLIPERLLAVGTQTSPVMAADMQVAGEWDNRGAAGDMADFPDADAVTGQTRSDGVGVGTTDTNNNVNVPGGMSGNPADSITVVNGQNANGTDRADHEQITGNAAQSAGTEDGAADTGSSSRPLWFRGLTIVWLLGMAGFLAFHVFSYLRMRHRIRRLDSGVRQVEPGICEIDGGHLSFVMGLIHPVIYLSSGLDPESRKVVLCHERVHLQRRDYLWKPLALVICCVHWFNPLVWLAFYLMNMDCEMSCDEKVVKLLGEESKKIYS